MDTDTICVSAANPDTDPGSVAVPDPVGSVPILLALLDPDPYIVKLLDPDPYIEYKDPQPDFFVVVLNNSI